MAVFYCFYVFASGFEYQRATIVEKDTFVYHSLNSRYDKRTFFKYTMCTQSGGLVKTVIPQIPPIDSVEFEVGDKVDFIRGWLPFIKCTSCIEDTDGYTKETVIPYFMITKIKSST
ncbi:MAG: hypothetical protein COU27_01180 [Candidatus Levybacteria bacterium CG10_big_fil_rev_8_21_14_0_10_36_7]|nr:MAG: hypothetical protein COU27_01180 [Candidatus Levybacteria bacterium CG10_big_fil_rev_8_21_14_0_10_36_7]